MNTPIVDSALYRLVAVFGICLTGGLARAAASSPIGENTSGALLDSESIDEATSELLEHHRHHHHGGITKFIAMSLDTLGVAPTKQPKIDKLQAALYKCMIPARDIENGLLSTLADGVAAGSIHMESADAAIGQLDAAATAQHDCSADTLNKLHAVLSRDERVTLIDKVRSHWNVWRQANSEANADGREKGGRLAELTRELNLTSEQAGKMSAALQTAFVPLSSKFIAKRVDAHVQQLSRAFVEKTFDAKTLTLNESGYLATFGAKKMEIFYETLTPLLTPEQRTTVAQHLREHAGQPLTTSRR